MAAHCDCSPESFSDKALRFTPSFQGEVQASRKAEVGFERRRSRLMSERVLD